MILHWNGKTWKQVPSPNPAVISGLGGVAATSATDAWAVGSTIDTTTGHETTLILHWNGKTWKQVPSPSPGGTNIGCCGVAATSASNAWAVGGYGFPSRKAFILRWNGTAWK